MRRPTGGSCMEVVPQTATTTWISHFILCKMIPSNPSRGHGSEDQRPFPASLVPVLFSLLLLPLLLHSVPAAGSESEGGSMSFEWQILTEKNFYSQIRLHPHILLFVAVPWSGELRSLTMEISRQFISNKEKFSSLRLMMVYGNHHQVLAKSLGAREGITILCYHHGVSFKYKGRRKAQDILSSATYLMSLPPGEFPLKTIDNSEALGVFLDSTDMSVLLLESCGWTSQLLSQHNGNRTSQGGLFSPSFHEETSRTLTSGSLKISKDMENDKVGCELGDVFSGIPWMGGFTSENMQMDAMIPSFGSSCSFDEYQKFKSFFSKLSTVARNFFLPPQRQKFGHVLERSFLSSLGVEDSTPWSLIIYYSGCPSCLRVIKEEDDILDVLEMDASPLTELVDGDLDLGPTLPVDRPSVLLFVDRSSNSLEIRRRSKEALNSFKNVALKYQIHQTDGLIPSSPKKSHFQVHRSFRVKTANHRLQISSLSQKVKLKDKVSITIINDGKHIPVDDVTDSQGGPLHEILTYLLGLKKQEKLSTVAKEAGFQLLSDDIDIEIPDPLPDQQEGLSDLASSKSYTEDLSESAPDGEKELNLTSSSLSEQKEQLKPVDTEPLQKLKEKLTEDLINELPTLTPDPPLENHMASPTKNENLNKEIINDAQVEEPHGFQGFKGLFYFSDGSYQFLRSLTGDTEVPRMVIIDPVSEQHFVFPDLSDFSCLSVSNFINGFLNGSLLPYQRSAALESSREAIHPPFVNLDFHETDSIPAVTADTFYELVLRPNQHSVQSEKNASNRDVLVLFSSSWCGFCQRMDLVLREVYRAFKGFANLIKGGTEKKNSRITKDKEEIIQSLPMIFRMDCTFNDCSGVLKSVGQMELLPVLLLLPVENRTVVLYEGDITVIDIIKFIAFHGSSSHHLVEQKGILWTEPEKRDDNHMVSKGVSKVATFEEFSNEKQKYYEVLKQHRNRQIQVNQVRSKLNGAKPSKRNVAVGSLLVATYKLLGGLFDKATILIVSANHVTGFQGLIINKFVNWDSVPALEYTELLKRVPLSFGGPVMHRDLPLVALTRRFLKDHYPQVLPSVYFLDQLATIHEIEEIYAGNRSATDLWFFWGYSGWNWNQLLDEIADGAWSLQTGSVEDLHWP